MMHSHMNWLYDLFFLFVICPAIALSVPHAVRAWPHLVRGWNAWLDFLRI